MHPDVCLILDGLSREAREELRVTPERELIRFHHGLGMYLRNGFRHGQFRGLMAHCRSEVQNSGEPMSFDALSSVAIREVWMSLQPGA